MRCYGRITHVGGCRLTVYDGESLLRIEVHCEVATTSWATPGSMPNMAARISRKVEWTVPDVLVKAKTTPDLVTVLRRRAIAIDGMGAPAGDPFQQALGALYGVAYTLKFARKKSGRATPFKVAALEGRWAAAGRPEENTRPPPETWTWRLRIAVPPDMTESEVATAIDAATSKKGGKLAGSRVARRVFLEEIPEQRCGRILHIGPYADEPRSFALLVPVMEAAGLRPARPHAEIYLGDPRRSQPSKLKTVLLKEGT
jgi:hypothetical protein